MMRKIALEEHFPTAALAKKLVARPTRSESGPKRYAGFAHLPTQDDAERILHL